MSHPLSRRTTAWLAAPLTLAAGLVSVLSASPAAADEDLVRVAWVCYVDEDGSVTKEPVERAEVELKQAHVLVEDRHLCVEVDEERLLDLRPIRELHPELEIFLQDKAPEGLTLVECSTSGTALTPATAGATPSSKQIAKSCSLAVPSGAGGSTGGGAMGGGVMGGGLMTRPGAGMPSAGSIECGSSFGSNPYAEGSGGKQGPTNGELLWQLTKDWLGGTAIVTGGAKAVLAGGGGALMGGAGGAAALDDWGKSVASTLGLNMEGRYKDATASLADQAGGFADAAQASADAAQQAAPGSPEAAAAADAAAKAKAAADAAAKASEAAKNAKDRATLGASHAAATKAAEDAKKAAEEAKKKEDEAKAKAAATPAPSSAPTQGTGSNPSGSDPKREACEQLRQQLWECEQNGWKSFECQDLANKLSGCMVDMTVALVSEDGALCGKPYLDEDMVEDALDHACGLEIAKYGPDSDPCSVLVEGVIGSMHHPDGCDPTVAYGGCPDPQTGGTLPDDGVVCFPAPPGAPPMPCVDVTGGGGPVVAHFVDQQGTVFLTTDQGVLALGTTDPSMPPEWVRP